MKTQTLGWLVGLGAVACSFTSCAEPATQCQVGLAGNNSFATVFTPVGKPSPAGCEMMNPNVVQLGDRIGMEFYSPPSADGTTYDTTKLTVAIKSDGMGQEANLYSSYACAPATCGPACTKDSDCMTGTCHSGSCTVHCGAMGDGCGGIALPAMAAMTDVDCGPCPTGQTCGGGGMPNVCGTGTCTPTTCAALGANCGLTGDGCGGTLNCGPVMCPSAGDTCGGAGVANVCGHPVPDADTTHTPYAYGKFAAEFPDANNLCQVVSLTSAQLNVTASPKPTATLPADSASYTWNNVNVYVTAADQGSQFEADMTYVENGCSASYHVVGLWPAVDCTRQDSMGNLIPDAMGNLTADPDRCNPCAEPSLMRFTGSGISPDYLTSCQQIYSMSDPYGRHPFYCVPPKPSGIPQLNPNPPTCAQNYTTQ